MNDPEAVPAPLHKTTASGLTQLQRQLARGELTMDDAIRKAHSGDKWFAAALPDAVAFPESAESVSKVVRFAYAHGIPVTARGAGYGYVGGCVPVEGGIVLSLAKMNRIREIHEDDFVAVVEPGVITAELQAAVEKVGRYYPPDPASRADCTIGGNIATNAGGPRCLKYGVTREYVLGLQVVLGDGTLIRVGSRTHKNKTGFDLVKLFVGSEGLLGIVTEATLKLLPLPPFRAALSIGYPSLDAGTNAIRAIFSNGYLPCALELADEFTVQAAQKRTGSPELRGCKAHLIVELDGQEKSVRGELPDLERIIRESGPLFVRSAFGTKDCETLWQLRREFSQALRDTGLTKLNEDIVVPRGKLKQLFELTGQIQAKYHFIVACFGHAGDGNIHVNIMVNRNNQQEREREQAALDDLFAGVIALGGVVSGEHGIGLAKLRWWPLAASEEVRHLHVAIKKILDEKGILNPGKFA